MRHLTLFTTPELEARAVAIAASLDDMVIFPDMDGRSAHEPAKLLRVLSCLFG